MNEWIFADDLSVLSEQIAVCLSGLSEMEEA